MKAREILSLMQAKIFRCEKRKPISKRIEIYFLMIAEAHPYPGV